MANSIRTITLSLIYLYQIILLNISQMQAGLLFYENQRRLKE